jgi:hypothetical protein
VRAFLVLDPRYDAKALEEEREELEQRGRSKAYDVTAWSLVHAFDLDAAWVDAADVRARPLTRPAASALPPPPAAARDREPVAWAVDAADDGCVSFAARALELGLAVHWADEAFACAVGGGTRRFSRGSLLVRRAENSGGTGDIEEKVTRAAARAGVAAVALATGRAPDEKSADLGGQHFHLLRRPSVALLANAPVASDAYGHLWHHLDQRVGVPFSILDAQSFGSHDLRRFNVLIVPPSGGIETLLAGHKEELVRWVEAGGTLIACASSAAALTKGRLGISEVTLREHALEELDRHRRAVARERASRNVVVDAKAVWDGERAEATSPPAAPGGDAADGKDGKDQAPAEEKDADVEELREEDAWAERFFPSGATLKGEVDPDAWITSGQDAVLPVLAVGSEVFLAKAPITTAVRLAAAADLRLGGLLWPEARERLADSAWLTVERKGNGQVILFAAPPAFRGYHLATARLFANAVVLAPGLGAELPDGF